MLKICPMFMLPEPEVDIVLVRLDELLPLGQLHLEPGVLGKEVLSQQLLDTRPEHHDHSLFLLHRDKLNYFSSLKRGFLFDQDSKAKENLLNDVTPVIENAKIDIEKVETIENEGPIKRQS